MNLPESSQWQTQERKSLTKLRTLLPEDRFIIREETGGDFGVDRVVELIVNGQQVSNYRFHAQCKSAKELKANEDGTYSYPIPVKTINYLINQQNSVIFLHLQNLDVMKWLWVEAVWRDANARGINLAETEQKEITCQFSQQLNDESIDHIYENVLERGQILRKTSEVIALSSPDSAPQILMDFANGTAVNLTELVNLLRKYGFFLINSGQLNILERIISQLPNSIREDSEISYIISYGKLMQGKNWEALNWLPTGAKAEGATPAFKQIGIVIKATVEHSLGIKSRQQYDQTIEQAQALDPDSIMAIQIELQKIRLKSIFQVLNRQQDWIYSFREVAEKLRKHPYATSGIKALADIYQWEVEGIALNVAALEEITRAQIARNLNLMSIQERAEVFHNQLGKFKAWLAKESQLIGSLDASNIDLAHILIPFTRASILFQFLYAFRLVPREFDPRKEFSDSMLVQLAEELERTAKVAEQLKFFDLSVRSHLVRAEVLTLVGNLEASKAAGKDAYQIASEIGAERFRKDGEEAMHGRSLTQMSLSGQQRLREMDQDLLIAKMSMEEVQQFASDVVSTSPILKERLPIIQRSIEAMHAGACERRDWCRHLRLEEELGHTSSPATFYARDPNRRCVCDLFGYKSKIELPDWESVINAFKKAYCSGCEKREPLLNKPGIGAFALDSY